MNEHDLNLKIIEKVKLYECLYDHNDPHYNDYKYRDTIWETIAQELNIKVRLLQRKWKRMKDNHKAQILRNLGKRQWHSRQSVYSKELRFLEVHFKYKSRNDPTKTLGYAELLNELSNEETLTNESYTKLSNEDFLRQETSKKQAILEEEKFEDNNIQEVSFEILEDQKDKDQNDIDTNIPPTNICDIEFVNIDTSINVNCTISSKINKLKVIDFEDIEEEDPGFIVEDVEYNLTNSESIGDPLVSHVNVNTINSAKIKEEKEDVIDLECLGDIDTVACNIDDNSRAKFVQDLARKKRDIYVFKRNLIRQIQKYECIYNPNAPGYDNLEYRQHVFDGIGKKIGVSGEIVKSKWINISSNYIKYKRKLSEVNGFVKPYQYSKYLEFLDEYITNNYEYITTPIF